MCWGPVRSLLFDARLHGGITAEHILCQRIAVQSEPMVIRAHDIMQQEPLQSWLYCLMRQRFSPCIACSIKSKAWTHPADMSAAQSLILDPASVILDPVAVSYAHLLSAKPASTSLSPVAATCAHALMSITPCHMLIVYGILLVVSQTSPNPDS